jgi:PKD repeat protein
MNKYILIAAAILCLTAHVYGDAVPQQAAQTIALNFYKVTVPAANAAQTATLNYMQTDRDGTVDFYVFDLSPAGGFVIVAANDNTIPVLGYSTESHFNSHAAQVGLSDWMKNTGAKIHAAISNNIQADARIRSLWAAYAQGVNPYPGRSNGLGPLLATTWNQSPYYNSLCPGGLGPNQAVTGCVATAMAQVMKYWSYPAAGVGSHSYDDDSSAGYSENYGTLSANFTRPLYWSAMPDNVSSNTDPVDSLMYELGVSVDMDYAPGGSGAWVLAIEAGPNGACAQYSYVNYFKYNATTIQGVQMDNYAQNDWISLMENEINAGRVIQYEGWDPTQGGHTWVCDGYDINDMLHMNWGWGGQSDGYYAVTNLNSGGFNPIDGEAALIGIEPPAPFALQVSASATAICAGSNTTLLAQGPAGASYTWWPATGLSCTSCASPIANPATSMLYTVTANVSGVTGSAAIGVLVTGPISAGFNIYPAPGCALPELVSFLNTSANATSVLWNFGDGASSTNINELHPYAADGVYNVSLYTANACGTDSFVMTQAVTIVGGAATATDQNICAGQSVTLTASGTGITPLNWYSDPNANTLIASGASYTTPMLNSTTTYYAGSPLTPAMVTAGAADTAFGAGSYFDYPYQHGLLFNNIAAQTLISADVYAQGAGVRTFMIVDSNYNVIDSISVNLANGEQTVPLNLAVPVENNLTLTLLSFTNLFRDSAGASYPYYSTDGTIQIIGNDINDLDYYYYFYNWKLQQAPCITPLTPVTVFVLSTGGISFSASGTGASVTFAPADSNATSYQWWFGDGATSAFSNPTHAYAANGNYSVALIVSNGSCADTVYQMISVTTLGVTDMAGLSGMTVSPNPARDNISMSINSDRQWSNCQLIINNALGQVTYSSDIAINSGANKFPVDISGLASGVYFLSLQNGKDVITTKFVKAGE